jgi:hypothetical protein
MYTEDKADLMDRCVEEEWWDSFVRWAYAKRENEIYKPISTSEFYIYLWRNLRELVASYRGYKEGEK